MSTPEAQPSNEPAGQATTAESKKSATTAVAVVAALAIGATGGWVIASSGGSDDEPAVAGEQGSGGDGAAATGDSADTAAAQTVVTSFAQGENRGLEEVHQGGDEDLSNVLVTTDWLAEQIDAGLAENNIVLVDVSEELASSELTQYDDGHIPGAHYIDWSGTFQQSNTREFISAEDFTELAQGIGLNEDSTLVIYGDNNNWFAAYAAWVFKLYGFEDVRLLDGGLNKWESVDSRELTQDVPQAEQGNWEAQPQNFDIRAFQPEVLEAANGDADVNLVDIRSPEEFNGEVGVDPAIFEGEGTTIWGHIPDAANVPWGSIVNEDGTFKDADEIRAIYEEAGVDFDKPIIAYCRIGERASHTWFALSQILGADVKVYDGGWTEWGNSVGVPVTNESGVEGGVWGTS